MVRAGVGHPVSPRGANDVMESRPDEEVGGPEK